MKFGKVIPILFAVLLLLPATTYARNFLRNLQIGSVGQDVLFVQQILNLSPLTQVAQNGPGSPGNETVFFGNATRSAIIKFQTLYANDILVPAGLAHATGVAGSFTLKKINELAAMYAATASSTTSVSSSTAVLIPKTQTNQPPSIDSITPTIINNGDTIVIKGKNFDATNNTVMVSIELDDRFTHVPSYDGTTISLQMNLTLPNYLENGMKNLTGRIREEAISSLILKDAFSAGPGDGSAYIPVTIYVKNKNGGSNSMQVLVLGIPK